MRWQVGVVIMLAAYFPAALWSVWSYVDPAPRPHAIQLFRPFTWEDGFAWRFSGQDIPIGKFAVYEDDRPLEQAENFQALEAVPGRYLQQANGLYFSARGDPNSNGRRYWAVAR